MGVLTNPLQGYTFLKGEELKAGVTVKLKKAEPITLPEDKEKFTVKEDSALVKNGVLAAGQTMKYTFDKLDEADNSWQEVVFENSSTGFYMSLSNVNPEADDVITIKRVGEGTGTRYNIALKEQ